MWYGVSLRIGSGSNAKNFGVILLRKYQTLGESDGPQFRSAAGSGQGSRCEKRLTEQLGEPEKAILTELVRVQHDIDSITACEHFIMGFRLGVRMMAECMDENDGDIREIGEHA